MTTGVTFIVPGPPVAKGRPRATAVGGHARMYTPRTPVTYEALVGVCAADAQAQRSLGVTMGPVAVVVRIIHPRPQRLMRRADPPGLLWAPVKPDIDNTLKAILDGCKCLWRDDAQVVQVSVSKHYAEKTGAARAEVTALELP